MGNRFPKDARQSYCMFTFFMQLFLTGLFSLISFTLVAGVEFTKGWFFLLFTLPFAFIFGKNARDSFRAIKESRSLSDIEALWKMEYESIELKGADVMYARAWVDTFPELAERIDPATGNIDLNRIPADKSWREVKVEIRSMIYNCPAARKAPKRKGTGRHSY